MTYIPPINGARPATVAPNDVEKANIANYKNYFRRNLNNPSDSYFEGNVFRVLEMAGKFEADAELQEIAQKAFENYRAFINDPKASIPVQTLTPLTPAKAQAKLSKRKQAELLNTIEEYFKRGDEPIPSQKLKRKTVKKDETQEAKTYKEFARELLLQHQETSGGNAKSEELIQKYITPSFQGPTPAAAATPAPAVDMETQELTKEFEKLCRENYAKEKVQNEILDEFFKDVEGYKGMIGTFDERYVAFLKAIDEALQFQTKGEIYNMLKSIAPNTHSLILESIKEAIVAKMIASKSVTKEDVAELLKPHVYGSQPAPVNASAQQIREMIETENKRHAEYMESVTIKTVGVQLVLANFEVSADK